MTIAFDYDGTLKRSSQINADECEMWGKVFDLLARAGHKVIVATAREWSEENSAEFAEWFRKSRPPVDWGDDFVPTPGIFPQVVFCGDVPKAEACRAEGHAVDVWVDDMPESVRGTVLSPIATAVLFEQ